MADPKEEDIKSNNSQDDLLTKKGKSQLEETDSNELGIRTGGELGDNGCGWDARDPGK